MPAVGSNQHVTKFDEAKKKKKVKKEEITFVTKMKIAYIMFTLLGTVWGIRLTHQVYQFKCVVNGSTIGYFSRRVECGNAYQNWIDSQPGSQTAIDNHVEQILENNPDMR